MKTNTQTSKPMTETQFQAAFSQYAQIKRRLDSADLKLADKTAALANKHQQDTAKDRETLNQLAESIQQYAENNRATLTNNGKTQTVKLTSGCLKWRKKPASVQINGNSDDLLAEIRRRKLSRFIRVKEEINKSAILAERDLFIRRPLDGLEIVDGLETFVIETQGGKS